MRVALIFLAVVISSVDAAAQTGKHQFPWINISQIAQCRSDTFRITAKVLDTYHCPPCPPGAICKPCDGDFLLVEDTEATPSAQDKFYVTPTTAFDKEHIYIFVLTPRNKAHLEMGCRVLHFETLKK